MIDNDHAVIHTLVRDLCSSASRALAPKESKGIFSEIIRKLEEHFRDEEEVMSRHEYPDAHAHRSAHSAILKLFREGRESLIAPNGKLSVAILERGEVILSRHVDKFDFELTYFLRCKESE